MYLHFKKKKNNFPKQQDTFTLLEQTLLKEGINNTTFSCILMQISCSSEYFWHQDSVCVSLMRFWATMELYGTSSFGYTDSTCWSIHGFPLFIRFVDNKNIEYNLILPFKNTYPHFDASSLNAIHRETGLMAVPLTNSPTIVTLKGITPTVETIKNKENTNESNSVWE